MPDYAEVQTATLTKVRAACLALPDASEQKAWTGQRFLVRKKNFAHVLAIHNADETVATVLIFTSPHDEREVLLAMGHPFWQPGYGENRVGMTIDGDTDWDEVAELMTESYCMLAPQKLAALVNRPE